MPPAAQDDEVDRPLLSHSGDETENGVGVTYGTSSPSEAAEAEAEAVAGAVPTGFTRNLGALDAFAIIISIVIGSGIFTSPGSIDTNVPSPGIALVIWLVGGGLAWTGASTMAELGTAIPGEGMSLW